KSILTTGFSPEHLKEIHCKLTSTPWPLENCLSNASYIGRPTEPSYETYEMCYKVSKGVILHFIHLSKTSLSTSLPRKLIPKLCTKVLVRRVALNVRKHHKCERNALTSLFIRAGIELVKKPPTCRL